jgi:hypothetical protein
MGQEMQHTYGDDKCTQNSGLQNVNEIRRFAESGGHMIILKAILNKQNASALGVK